MISKPSASTSFSPLADIGVLALLGAVLYGIVCVAQRWQAPLLVETTINLSLRALPVYTLLSLLRGFAAYGLSLLFTLVYGYYAARQPKAERVMVPLLDILQSIPVLGFLPGAVMALVALFPRTNAGLELACILMIFTGQVWNMTFSFYQSLRAIPLDLHEVSSIYQFNWWQRFFRVELPASAVPLAWNSMMAMAGGWFFLMVCEAFTLGSHDFRLPGLGAYISVAMAQHNTRAIVAGLMAMVAMIVIVDTFVWRPLLVWTQRFRLEDTASSEVSRSFILEWFQQSWLIRFLYLHVARPVGERLFRPAPSNPLLAPAQPKIRWANPLNVIVLLALVFSFLFIFRAAWSMIVLLIQLQASVWARVLAAAFLTLLRVAAAVFLGSLWTVPVGIWIGRSDLRRSRFQPFVQVAASFPAPMLYPLVLMAMFQLGWGLGIGSVFLMVLGTQWYLLFNVIAGASSVPSDLREAAQAYQFTAGQRWRMVWWPAVFPSLITGWITAAGGAWNASIVAEYVSSGAHHVTSTYGLGSLISVAAAQGNYALLAASVLTMAAVVVMINRFLWKPLYQMAQTRYAY